MIDIREEGQRVPGLRERKKAKARAAIQQHALRLFREQGYSETTVEQIAEAAEVSPSTFFRYFPTKEDVVLLDVLDPIIIEAFRAQPPDSSPSQALLAAFRSAVNELPEEEQELERARERLILTTPELRARMLNDVVDTIQMLSGLIAERVGRTPDDFAVRVYSGALIGVMFSVMYTAVDHPEADLSSLMEDALKQLGTGLTL